MLGAIRCQSSRAKVFFFLFFSQSQSYIFLNNFYNIDYLPWGVQPQDLRFGVLVAQRFQSSSAYGGKYSRKYFLQINIYWQYTDTNLAARKNIFCVSRP